MASLWKEGETDENSTELSEAVLCLVNSISFDIHACVVFKLALRILLKDYDSTFDELLEKSESVKIHDQNLQKLMIEIYKTMKNLNPSYIWEFHERKVVKYDLRTKNLCRLPKTRTTKFGIESLSFRGSLLWNSLCDTIKALPSVAAFKREIKHWLGDKCNCRICK